MRLRSWLAGCGEAPTLRGWARQSVHSTELIERQLALRLLGAVLVAALSAPLGAQTISAPVALYDDADPAPAGKGVLSTYFGYSRYTAGHDISGPSAYINVGLHRRFDVSADVAMVRSQFEENRIRGVGDSYLGVKILVVPEGRRRPALALKPMIEVLGASSVWDNVLAPQRVNFVPSWLTQKSFDNFRVYYMGGYITRGIWFHSLGAELNRWSRVTPVVIVSTGRITRELDLVRELGLNRSRMDYAGGVAVAFTRDWSVFGMAGRSFGRTDLNSTSYQFSGGFSFNFRLWGER